MTAWLRRHRPPGRRWAAALACAAVLAAAGLGAGAYPAGAAGLRWAQYQLGGKGWPSQTEVRVLDVGQGTAVLVRTPDRHAALFDAGPAGCGLAEQLRSTGGQAPRSCGRLPSSRRPFRGAGRGSSEPWRWRCLWTGRRSRRRPAPAAPAGGEADGPSRYASGGSEARQYLEMRARLAEKGCRLAQATSGAALAFHGVAVKFYRPGAALGAAGWRGALG